MVQASAIIPTVETIPDLDAPLCELTAGILNEWEQLGSTATPPGPSLREDLERFQRQMLRHAHDLNSLILQTASEPGSTCIPVPNSTTTSAHLLPLKAGHRIPLHDHPSSVVVVCLLTGRAIVSSYQVVARVRSGHTMSLQMLGRSLLNPGEFKLGQRGYGNAHKLSALMDALFIEVIVGPQPSENHHRFITFEPQLMAADGIHRCIAIGQPGSSPAAEPCNAMER